MDYNIFCKTYYETTNIPVTLLHAAKPEYSTLTDLLSITPYKQWELFPMGKNPSFCGIPPDILYGRVHVERTDYDVILGPVCSVPMTDAFLHKLLHELMIPAAVREQAAEFFCAVPTINALQLGKHLILIHLALNQIALDVKDLFDTLGILSPENAFTGIRDKLPSEEQFRSAHAYELELYQYIREGSLHLLERFLKSKNSLMFYEGKKAASPLRHSKNVLISTLSRAVLFGAVPGGVPVEKAYQLQDYYIQECERLTNIESVNRLHYTMLIDLCRRAGESRIPEGLTGPVWETMNYIRSHVDTPLPLKQVAAHVNRSVSHLMKEFKGELGFSIGSYIMKCRLEEARSLLVYSEQSLSEISSTLCFSSQSYFQNVFKKQYGITPLQYRRTKRRF